MGRDGRDKPVIWGASEAEYFSRDDWTGQIKLKWQEKFGCAHAPKLVRVANGIRRISASGAKRTFSQTAMSAKCPDRHAPVLRLKTNA
jgi:hypothetical protein